MRPQNSAIAGPKPGRKRRRDRGVTPLKKTLVQLIRLIAPCKDPCLGLQDESRSMASMTEEDTDNIPTAKKAEEPTNHCLVVRMSKSKG